MSSILKVIFPEQNTSNPRMVKSTSRTSKSLPLQGDTEWVLNPQRKSLPVLSGKAYAWFLFVRSSRDTYISIRSENALYFVVFTFSNIETIMGKQIGYSNGELTIVWQPEFRRHAGTCVKVLPNMYHPRECPWIRAESAATEELIAQVKKCPSGALSYRLEK